MFLLMYVAASHQYSLSTIAVAHSASTFGCHSGECAECVVKVELHSLTFLWMNVVSYRNLTHQLFNPHLCIPVSLNIVQAELKKPCFGLQITTCNEKPTLDSPYLDTDPTRIGLISNQNWEKMGWKWWRRIYEDNLHLGIPPPHPQTSIS